MTSSASSSSRPSLWRRALDAIRGPVPTVLNRSELGSLVLVEVDDARRLAARLFRRTFGHRIPRAPRHFVLLRKTPRGEKTVGYVHYTRNGNAYLGGGLVVSPFEFRRLDAATASTLRGQGGFAEWAVRTSTGYLGDADAVFAYMGDAKSIRVNERVGFHFTGRRHLYVLWSRDLPAGEREELIDRIAAIGPF